MKTALVVKALAVVIVAAVFLFGATSLSSAANLDKGASQYNLNWVTYAGTSVPYTSSYNTWWIVDNALTSSKLIVNQPNGETQVTITGELNGLVPSATYDVYLSNPWYYGLPTDWTLIAYYSTGGAGISHSVVISSESIDYSTGIVSFSGTYDVGTPNTLTGTITGTELTMNFVLSAGHVVYINGTIGSGGMMTGSWLVTNEGSAAYSFGTWTTPSPTAGTSWQGYFTSAIPYFTFTTDSTGAGSWHINLNDSIFSSGTATYSMSVWINGPPSPAGTIIISPNFSVTVTVD